MNVWLAQKKDSCGVLFTELKQQVVIVAYLFLPVLLAYSIEGGTSTGVALLQLP